MNNDLISRSALLDSFDVRKVTEYDESGCGMDYKAVPVEAIEKATAVDAEPVRHGYNATSTFYSDLFVCSECGFVCEITRLEYEDGYIPGMGVPNAYEYDCNYCPECGAKMTDEKARDLRPCEHCEHYEWDRPQCKECNPENWFK